MLCWKNKALILTAAAVRHPASAQRSAFQSAEVYAIKEKFQMNLQQRKQKNRKKMLLGLNLLLHIRGVLKITALLQTLCETEDSTTPRQLVAAALRSQDYLYKLSKFATSVTLRLAAVDFLFHQHCLFNVCKQFYALQGQTNALGLLVTT